MPLLPLSSTATAVDDALIGAIGSIPPPPLLKTTTVNKDHHPCHRHQLPTLQRQGRPSPLPPSTAAAVGNKDGRHHRHHQPNHCVVVIDGGGKDSTATTTIDYHRRTTAVGSVPELPPTTTTATLDLIALALALPWRRIERRGGKCAPTRLIHRCRGCRCWHRLHHQ